VQISNRGGHADAVDWHPTSKPVELYAYLLLTFANPGNRIFDPMMGSQSSRIAAYHAGLDYWGCEIDKEYFSKGCERFDRECRGIIKQKDGTIVQQLTLF
jgi:DNA modification methylase